MSAVASVPSGVGGWRSRISRDDPRGGSLWGVPGKYPPGEPPGRDPWRIHAGDPWGGGIPSLGVSLREIPGGDPHGGIPGASSERIPVGIPGAIPGVISGRGSLGEPWGNPPWRVSEGDPWEGIRGGSLCWGIAGGIPGGGGWDRGQHSSWAYALSGEYIYN
jgi:hypothetical protein